MFGILVSAGNFLLTWLVRSLLVKFVMFFALYFVTSEFIGLLIPLLPSSANVTGAMSSLTSATWYFLNMFSIQTGLSMVVSAYATRFIIRRIPIIG
jgi:Protein of unknown function (DUF2523)